MVNDPGDLGELRKYRAFLLKSYQEKPTEDLRLEIEKYDSKIEYYRDRMAPTKEQIENFQKWMFEQTGVRYGNFQDKKRN